MKNILLPSLLLTLSFMLSVSAETWTAADGQRTTEAEFIKLEGDQVTMRASDGRVLTFPLSQLAEESQQRARELAAAQNPAAQGEQTQLQEDFGTRLKILEDDRLNKFEFEANPQYFILYYSASWCGPCRQMAPESVKYYNKNLADNPLVELVMVSSDQDKKAAQTWAEKEKMPWPILLKSDAGRVEAVKENFPTGIPHMVLVDGEGKALATGTQGVKKKVKELIEAK